VIELRDSQRSRVYRWERKNFLKSRVLTEAQCESTIKKVCKLYKMPKELIPEIAFSNNGYLYPGFDFGANKISINKGQNNLWLCCHESIHAVLYMYYGLSRCWHGGEFVFLMLTTMSKLEKRPKTDLMESANEMGIKYAEPDFLNRIYKKGRYARNNTDVRIHRVGR
jgi:hypothetical protein